MDATKFLVAFFLGFPLIWSYANCLNEKQKSFVLKTVDEYKLNNVSDKCLRFYTNLDNVYKIYNLLDASSVWPTGLFSGNMYDLGVYPECMKIDDQFEEEEYRGRYCLTYASGTFVSGTPIKFRRGRCVPSFCSNQDVGLLLGEDVEDSSCFTHADEKPLSVGAIITIVFLGIFGIMTISSTVYEAYLTKAGKKSPHILLTAFSAITNTKKIFQTTTNSEQLLCLNGLKAISMITVIYFHEYQNTITGPLDSLLILKEYINNKWNMYMFQLPLAVDTFFTISGILVSYQFHRNWDKNEKIKRVPVYGIRDALMSYVYRYIRLTPVLGVMILLHAFIFEYINQGPMSANKTNILVDRCKAHWWSALLYVQNYVNPMADCVSQAWYLSADMQLYICTPIILVARRKFPKVMTYPTAVLLGFAVLIPFYISYTMNLPYAGFVMDDNGNDYMVSYYMKTHCRYGVYIIGLICGEYIYYYKKNAKPIQIKTILNLLAWTVVLAALVACYMGAAIFMGKEKNVLANAIFNATFRMIFSAALSGFVYLCVTGNGYLINDFLSLPIFQILAKLSYSMYLAHYSVTILRVTGITNLRTFSTFWLLFDFCGDFTITVICSYFLVIMFEFPFDVINKFLFQGKQGDPQVTEKQKKN